MERSASASRATSWCAVSPGDASASAAARCTTSSSIRRRRPASATVRRHAGPARRRHARRRSSVGSTSTTRETAPLLEYYRKIGQLREVDGTGTRDEVFGRVVASWCSDRPQVAAKRSSCMRAASVIVAEILAEVRSARAPGVTTAELDDVAEQLTRDKGREAGLQGLRGAGRDLPGVDLRLDQRRGRARDPVDPPGAARGRHHRARLRGLLRRLLRRLGDDRAGRSVERGGAVA